MMPKVGQKITVTGVLASAKLGWIGTFDNWGIYIYTVHNSDNSKMNALASFQGQTVAVTGALRYSPGSSSTRTDVASVPEHFFFDVAEVKVTTQRPAAAIEFREARFRKPPLVDLYFDVVLRNKRAESRWFILPSNLGPESRATPAKGGVDGVEVFAPRGKGRVVIGHFLGTGGFYALLLPARSEVRLRLFPISFWGDLPDQLQIEVVMAKSFIIGAEKAETWFGASPASSPKADIMEDSLNHRRMLSSRHTPDHKEVSTSIEEDSRVAVLVSLKRKE
jgi:hypothetical protein